VDLRAFLNVNFAFGCLFSFIVGIGLYGSVYVIPLFLGRVRHLNSLQIGETMFITGVAMFASAPIIGKLSGILDMRRMLAVGMVMIGVSMLWLGELTNQSSFWELLGPQALRGVGTMMAMLPVNQLALGMLPPHQLKNASGLYNLMRNLGGAMGIAGINAIATARERVHTLHLDEQVTWARSAAVNTVNNMTMGFEPAMGPGSHLAALKQLSLLVQREALTLTYNDVFLVLAISYFFALPLTFLLRKSRPGGAPAEAH
jgi:DHA2 family multidrug resistance protein